MSTRWLYIGCRLSELPANFLEDSKKLTKEQIREILQLMPIEDGSVMAESEDELVNKLISSGIFPIKIKPYSNVDDRIMKLKNIRNKASKISNSDKYIEEARILNQLPPPMPRRINYKLILLAIILLITGGYFIIHHVR